MLIEKSLKDGSMPLVSVVILSWNRLHDVQEGLTRLMQDSYPNLELIVVDNGSEDGTREMLTGQFPNVSLIALDTNLGVAAYNIGFRKANGEYVLILDDDSFPAAGAIGKMVARFIEDTQLGIVAFDVRSYDAYDAVVEKDRAQCDMKPNQPRYLMGFNGAGAGVRAEVFKVAGYYPGEFFLYMNEMDFALRILDAGYRIASFADIVAYHKNSPINRTSRRAPFYYTRNTFWVIWKNYPWWQLLTLSAKLCFLVLFHSLEQQTTIYLKALWSALFHIRMIAGLRKPVAGNIAATVRLPLELPFTFYR